MNTEIYYKEKLISHEAFAERFEEFVLKFRGPDRSYAKLAKDDLSTFLASYETNEADV